MKNDLLKLQEMFPHERVLERMIEEESRQNKAFRRPEEYDLYDEKAESKMKFRDSADGQGGVKKPSESEYGSKKLEDFKLHDRVALAVKTKLERGLLKAKLDFEKDLYTQVLSYYHQIQEDGPTDAPKVTMR